MCDLNLPTFGFFQRLLLDFFLFTLFSFKFSHRMCTLPQPMMLLLSLLTATMCHKVGKYCYKCFRWLCGRVWLCVCVFNDMRACVWMNCPVSPNNQCSTIVHITKALPKILFWIPWMLSQWIRQMLSKSIDCKWWHHSGKSLPDESK